jgi:hypothetical protein
MAEPFIGLALQGATPLINNYEKAWDPLKFRAQKMRERRKGERKRDNERYDEPTPEELGWVLKKRSEVRSDEEIVERVPRNQQVVPYRPSANRRASSLDGNDHRDRRDGRNDRRVGAYRGRHDDSDSEGSVPPRSRVSHTRSRRSSSKSNSSSEDLGSSTDDERRCRAVNRKKWLTGGLAAVATIHAAAKVYSSLEARDKRQAKLLAGEISPEEARKQRNKGRVQDAAAVSIAALGIRGAVGEWHEVEEKAEEHKKYLKQREENHRKRMEKQKRLREAMREGHDSGRYEGRGGDDGDYRPRAIKNHGEYDRHRSKSMSTYDDDRDDRALVRSKSRRRSDE